MKNTNDIISKPIFHITYKSDFDGSHDLVGFMADSLDKEGFIHCSTKEQILDIANSIFHGKSDLLLLQINQAELSSEVKFENLEAGERMFPHIYGPIDHKAIEEVFAFEPGEDGSFTLPF